MEPIQEPAKSRLAVTETGIETSPREEFENMLVDTNAFAGETVYFDFDRAAVRPGEASKVETVAAQLKEKSENKLLIDGHCDERGTEEYNRALGERRALSLREYLVNLGVSPDRIRTRSWGEDRPADPAHDEAAWTKNRRGEFILLLPKN
jgi:peptidoglycan-associated lipoprotein